MLYKVFQCRIVGGRSCGGGGNGRLVAVSIRPHYEGKTQKKKNCMAKVLIKFGGASILPEQNILRTYTKWHRL